MREPDPRPTHGGGSAAGRSRPLFAGSMAAAWLLLIIAAACTTARPPAFEPARSVGGDVLIFRPEVRLGSSGTRPIEEVVVDGLIAELRRVLTGKGLALVVASRDPSLEASRSAVAAAWRRERSAGRHRLRADARLGIEEALRPVREWGADKVLAVLLSRRGVVVSDGEYVPRPSGEILERPEDRLDYKIPRASDYADQSVVLELLMVDAATGRIVTHRRASHPAATERDIVDVLPRLVGMVSRGLSGGP